MGSMTLGLLKQRNSDRRNKGTATSKRIENAVLSELREKLDNYLSENDKVMFEVNPDVVGEFINVLSGSLMGVYGVEQIDTNKFVFWNKELEF